MSRQTRGHKLSATLPQTFRAQLALLVKTVPEGDAWLHELKYDGYRIACRIDSRDDIRLISRNGKDWTSRFPEVRDAARELAVQRAFLDGEVAVLLPDGRTSFQALQNTFSSGARQHLAYFVFDLLHLDGEDVGALPLEERKRRLHALVAPLKGRSRLRYSDHVVGNGARFFAAACRKGLEGVVSKRRDLPYQPGRGTGWVKTKCLKRQELVIGGFTDPQGSRVGIGALLIGVYNAAGELRFAGKVGTGFTEATAQDLRHRLEKIEQSACPFTPCPSGSPVRNAHWVRPILVAEVAFSEWTAEGKVRHPSFQGLRADKRAREVVQEIPATVPVIAGGAPTEQPSGSNGATVVAGVRLTHPDRVLWPAIGLTKLGLARFYEDIAGWVLPHLAGRPLTLLRCPTGIGDCFFVKHSGVWAPPSLRRVRIREKKKVGEYLVADSSAALIALAQMDVLEIHTWNSTVEHIERPDRVVFDLDPGPEVKWPAVLKAAKLVRATLKSLQLQSFVKTTGGRGLHVVVPLVPHADWAACLTFTRALAETIVRHDPSTYTTKFSKAGREGKILVDYLRNNRANTAVAAYSTRATPRATVSVPLAWDELSSRLRSDHFTVANLRRRWAQRDDPWQAYWTCKQRLAPALLAALNTDRGGR